MKYRIAVWATAGFLVAGFWALLATGTVTSGEEPIRNVWTLVIVSCPVAIAGMHYPISLVEALVVNAVTYGTVGIIVEGIRGQLRHSR